MGFKDYMDRNGKFITEVDANRRVEEMASIRQALMERLDFEEEQRDIRENEIARAHQAVLQDRQEQAKGKAAVVA